MIRDAHTLSVNEVLLETKSSVKGLSSSQAEKRLLKNGPNEIEAEKKVTPLKIFLLQFKNLKNGQIQAEKFN